MYEMNNSYYSKVMGYVIDGQHFGHDIDRASSYLVRESFMDPDDAYSYLRRLVRSFTKRTSVGVPA